MKQILVKTAVLVLFFMVSFVKGEAQDFFGESWYKGGIFFNKVTNMSPDGKIILVNDEKSIKFLSALDGTTVREIDKASNKLDILIWTPDNASFLSVSDSIRLLDTATLQPYKTIDENFDYITSVSFSPGGKYLMAGGYSDTYIYDVKTWARIDYSVVEGSVSTFLPGDSTIVTVVEDYTDKIIVSRFPSGDTLAAYSMRINDGVDGIALHHKTKSVTIATHSMILVMKIDDGRIISVTPKEPSYQQGKLRAGATLSPNDNLLLIGGKIYDAYAGYEIMDLNAAQVRHISPDWKRFLVVQSVFSARTCTTDDMPRLGSNLKMVNDSGELLWRLPPGHNTPVKTITFDTLSNTISSISSDSVQIHWDTVGNIKKLEYVTGFTPDTNNISISGNYTIVPGGTKLYVRDTRNDSIICVLNETYSAPEAPKILFQAWAWAPNEKYVFTCSKSARFDFYDGIFLKMWDVSTGKVIDSIGLPCYATMIQVSPDGKAVVLGTEENGIMYLKITDDIISTSVVYHATEEMALSFHPNPLQEASTISYALPNDGIVKLALYDILGNEFAVIHNGFKSAGAYTIPFKNTALPNGMYFLKMSAGGKTLAYQINILK